MALSTSFGASIKRNEDPSLIRGERSYVDDITFPGTAHMAILRSPHAHAKIRRIDTSKALKKKGVLSVLTGEAVREGCNTLQLGWDASAVGSKVPARYPLAVDKVRYAGEPVVAVIAVDPYLADDALDSIEVEYDPLPAITDPEKAMGQDTTLVHDELGTNVPWSWKIGPVGDVEKAFREAHVVVKQRMTNQRLIPVAIEPRGAIASYDKGTGSLNLWSATQIPHLLRKYVSYTLKIPENKVRVVAPEVGGGFGSKLNFYPEEALVSHASRILGRPVKWNENRRENMLSTIHGRDYVIYVEAAFQKDGTITGLRCKVISDVGAYYMHLTPVMPTLTGFMVTGCYKIPNVFYETHLVLTNKMAMDAYRGAGRPEATYIIERVMDLAASELKIDPAEIRKRNFIPTKEFPFTTSTGLVYDSGDYAPSLEKALEISNYRMLRDEQKRRRGAGRSSRSKLLGIGLSCYTEICGWGPSSVVEAVYPKTNAAIGKWEYASVRFEQSGKLTVGSGTSPHGQGHETSWAQIVSDELGVDPQEIVVLHGDTSQVPYGVSTYASRSAAVGGVAIHLASKKVREKAIKLGAHLLEARADDLVFEGGKVYVKGSPTMRLGIQEIAHAAYVADKLPEGMEPGLEATQFYNPPNFTFPFGTIVAVVEVDTVTGQVDLTNYFSVDDCGRVINPMIVEGQLHGGAAQGIAQALFEEAIYDEQGNLLTSTLSDYFVPTAVELPQFVTDRTVTPSPSNPLGVKGVGEAATIGSTPAVVNAVMDALAPLGIKHIDMPLRADKIWDSLVERKAGSQ